MYIKAENITTLYSKLVLAGLEVREEFNNNHGSAVAVTDQVLKADSCDFDWDLSTLSLSENTWHKFLIRYFPDPSRIHGWLKQAESQAESIDSVLSVQTDGRHHWGPCLLGISYRRKPDPRLTLFSRATYLPKPGIYELILVHKLSEALKTSPRFTWMVSSLWWEPLGIMLYLSLTNPRLLECALLQEHPNSLVRYIQRDLKALRENRCRYKHRLKTLNEIQRGKQESLWVKDLKIEN